MRYDKHTGLYMPDLSAAERRELRTRAYRLIERVQAGKATPAEVRELDGIGTTLYGDGSGWEGAAERDRRMGPMMRQALSALRERGTLTSEDVVRSGAGLGEFVDAGTVRR